MAYKILINSKGVPVLVEVPRKEDFEVVGFIPGLTYEVVHPDYNEALSTALADEKNHVPFKDGIFVMELVRTLANNKNNFYSFGQTFDLPENIGVSIWCNADCPEGTCCHPDSCQELKLAILTHKSEIEKQAEEVETLIVEFVKDCKLVREGSEPNGHDCWGNYEFNSYNYVYIDGKEQRLADHWWVIHDGKDVKEFRIPALPPDVEYQEKAIGFSYGWTPSTEKDYKNQKQGFEYRMILKVPPSQPAEDKPSEGAVEEMTKLLIKYDSRPLKLYFAEEDIYKAMQEYASLQRNEAIQECIDELNNLYKDAVFLMADSFMKSLNVRLEKKLKI